MKQVILIFLLISAYTIKAQTPTIGDCLGAIPVCQSEYFEEDSPEGPGNYDSEINFDNCVNNEDNSTWYTFTVQETGNFGFLLTPNNEFDDYDWSLFNLTGKSCEDIINTPEMVVSCNAAGGGSCDGLTGANGDTEYNYQNFGCGNNPPGNQGGFSAFNDLIPVQEGETYALLIINWTGSPDGYTLSFDIADVDIFDETNPTINSSEPLYTLDCNLGEYNIGFSEFTLCNSFEMANVVIDGPEVPDNLSIISVDCTAGANYSDDYTIVFDPPLNEPGEYNLLISGVEDLCGNVMEDFSTQFIIESPEASTELALDTLICNSDSIMVDGFVNNNYTYTWNDGITTSQRVINQPGEYILTLEADCIALEYIYNVGYLPINNFPEIEVIPDYCSLGVASITFLTDAPNLEFSIDSNNVSQQKEYDMLSAGMYQLTMRDEFNCVVQRSLTIPETEIAYSVDFTEDVYKVDYKEEIQLSGNINGDVESFNWIGDNINLLSCNNCLDPSLIGIVRDTFYYSAVDSLGCEIRDFIIVDVIIPRDFYAPNTFTPNNDGINEKFTIFSSEIVEEIETLKIYNRWGELIFENNNFPPNDLSEGWNGLFKGSTINNGSYTWYAELNYLDGVTVPVTGIISISK